MLDRALRLPRRPGTSFFLWGVKFDLAYWRLAGGLEVDFVLDDLSLAIEAKASRQVHGDHLKRLRELAVDHRVGRRVVVSLDQRARRTEDGIEILPWRTFAHRLWDDEILAE